MKNFMKNWFFPDKDDRTIWAWVMRLGLTFLFASTLFTHCYKEDEIVLPAPKPKAAVDSVFFDYVVECKRREGFRSMPYECDAGTSTIGYGQTNFTKDSVSKKEATQMLHKTLDKTYRTIQKELPYHNRNQHLAVTLLAYNIGLPRLKSYELWQRIKNKQPVWGRWYKIRYYKSDETGEYVESDNLKHSRLFELWLYTSQIDKVKDVTKNTLKTHKNI